MTRQTIDRYVRSLRARLIARIGLAALLLAAAVPVVGVAAWLAVGAPALGPDQSHLRAVGLAAGLVLCVG